LTDPALFLERTVRGVRLERARLLGPDFEREWAAPEEAEAEDLPALAGAWVVETLASQRLARRIGLLVVDTAGSCCAWVSTPGGDGRMVPALVRQGVLAGAAGEASGFGGSTAPGATLGGELDLPGAGSIEGWSDGAGHAGEEARIAAVSVADAAVRVLLDVLDAGGVRVDVVQSLWQASASGWVRPMGDGSGAMDAGRVVAEDAGLVAAVVVEPRGRLNWCWATGNGSPVAAGSLRLPRRAGDATGGEASVLLGSAEAGRLAADWLGWSAQLGRGPGRVRVILPSAGGPDPGEAGHAIGSAWPDATVELITDDDPVGRTVRAAALRAGGTPDEGDTGDLPPARALVGLTRRPGRDHRSAHLWLGAGLALVAVLAGVVGAAIGSARRSVQAQSVEMRARWTSAATSAGADRFGPVGAASVVDAMERLLSAERRRLEPTEAGPVLMDVMSEVDTLAQVLGNDFVEIRSMDINQTNPRLDILVRDPTMYEEIQRSLREIGDTRIVWTRSASGRRLEGQLVFDGRWTTDRSATRN